MTARLARWIEVDAAVAISIALSTLIGLSLGVFGGGGSILAVPVLVYVTRIAPETAVGMSLAIVGATSLTASYAHHRGGRVRIPVALLFGGAGIATAYLGAKLTHLVSERILMLLFSGLMIVVATLMLLRGRTTQAAGGRAPSEAPKPAHALAAGAGVGAITGFLGVGGGFLVVPALVAFTGLSMREAVGTSLLVIAMNSAAGLVGHMSGSNAINLVLTASLTAAAVVGAIAGERLGRRLSLDWLRRGFAVFVLLVGLAVAVTSLLRGGAS